MSDLKDGTGGDLSPEEYMAARRREVTELADEIQVALKGHDVGVASEALMLVTRIAAENLANKERWMLQNRRVEPGFSYCDALAKDLTLQAADLIVAGRDLHREHEDGKRGDH